MSALIDVIKDIVNLVVSFAGDIVDFIMQFIDCIYDVFEYNPIMAVLLILILIKIVVKIKELV